VRFVSTRFVPTGADGEEIDPGTYALELTRWLRQQLMAEGLEVGEPVVEDWGCLLGVHHDAARLSIGIGSVTGGDGEWLVFVEAVGPGLLASLFRHREPPDPAPVAWLAERVDRALHAEPAIGQVTWFAANRRTGEETDHAAHPG
jgi:hypothetical protein